MVASAIRGLAASSASPLVAAAFFEKIVQVWDINSRDKITEFPTVFCAGARNLALSPRGDLLVAGLSVSRGKVAAYEFPAGKKLWERNFIYPSFLRFSPSGQSIMCTSNRRSVSRLDARTGDTLETVNNTSQRIEGPNGEIFNIPMNENDPIRLIGRNSAFNVRRISSAVMDVQFFPHGVCWCEVCGSVRCVGLVDGELKWVSVPPPNSQIVRLHYSRRLGAIFAIRFDFAKGKKRNLIRFDPLHGTHDELCEFDSWEEVFLETTDQLVTSAGEIRDVSSGQIVGRLQFPQKDYPGD